MSDGRRYWINPADNKVVPIDPSDERYVEVIEYEAFERLQASTIVVNKQLIAFRHALKDIKQKMILRDIVDIKEEIRQLVHKVIEENPKCKN